MISVKSSLNRLSLAVNRLLRSYSIVIIMCVFIIFIKFIALIVKFLSFFINVFEVY